MSKEIQISFVILSWNSERFLEKCFDSIIAKCKAEALPIEIFLIDNGSSDGSREIVDQFEERYPEIIKKIYLDKNMGTTYPRNLGSKQAKGKYICILDSDTELLEGTFKELFDIFDNNEDIGMIVCQLILRDRSIQVSVKKFPAFIQKLSKLSTIFLGRNSVSGYYTDFPFESKREVDTAISAFWLYRRELHASVGYLDENIFYAPEDLDYCVRIWKAGYRILYNPNFKVFHDTQQISHKSPFSRIAFSHFMGLIYYYRKHGGWFSASNKYRKTDKELTSRNTDIS